MASFHAELHLMGTSYRVVRCSYACHQLTDVRGRPNAKVRHEPLHLTVDVPNDGQLLNWATTAHKPLTGEIVFYDTAQLVAYETIAFTAGECVGYRETFESGAGNDGAYVCQLTVVAPAFELRSGGTAVAVASKAAMAAMGIGGGAEELPSAALAANSAASAGADAVTAVAAVARPVATAAAIAAANATVVSRLKDLKLTEEVKAANPDKGMSNCADIATAMIARLRGTDPSAVAKNTGIQQIPDIEAKHNTAFEFGHDFTQAFDIIRNSPEGTIGLLLTVPIVPGVGHVVVIVNKGGVPTIIEGQHWDGYNPAGVCTNPAWAEKRYGSPDKVNLGLAIVPPSIDAEPLVEPAA